MRLVRTIVVRIMKVSFVDTTLRGITLPACFGRSVC